MKKSFLFSLLILLTSGLFAQKKTFSNAEKNAPSFEPSPNLDLTAPVVTCLNGLSVNVMPTGAIQLWASDFLLSVSDNVTPTDQIKIAIRKAGTGFGFPLDAQGNPNLHIIIDCNHLGTNAVELWAKDQTGNVSHCIATVIVQDNMQNCNGSPWEFDSVQMCISSGCNAAPMQGVTFNISGTAWFQPPLPGFVSDSMTGPEGCAKIYVPVSNNSFVITPEKDDDLLNGLTTYDLLLISKHILGTEPLGSPTKMIAADANKSGSLTTFDLVELRKVLLGTYTELPNNTAWRFVDADFEFPNPMNPFAIGFPEFISVEDGQLTDSLAFVGIKIGDVDCSTAINNGPPPDYPDAFMAMPDTFLLAGQMYDIPLYMVENGLWQGYQFKLDFDVQKLEFQNMVYHNLTGPGNWGTHLVDQGTLTTSWFQIDAPGAFGPSAPMAILRFRALENGSLKNIIKIEDESLHPEGYAGWGAEKRDLLLSFVPQLKPGSSDPNAEKNAPSFEPIPNLDLTPPVLTCRNGLTTNMMPTGAIQRPASDFLLSVSDNVTPTNEIKIAIRKAGTGFGFPMDAQGNPLENITFDCDELGTNAVELWAKDIKGNTAHCQTYLIVQDNLGACLGNSSWDWMIEMCAVTEFSEGLEEMEYIATGTNPNEPFYAFEVDGPFEGCGYLDVPLGSDITAFPIKDDNPLNGVTTYDLLLISKHIRGIEKLNTPYKMIAADADRNGVIDSTDITELWKLIDGTYTELPNNTSWRFVDKSYQFPDYNNPFATVFPESIQVQNIQTGVSAEFVGIKVGDVNYTAVPNASLSTEKSLTNAEKNAPSYEPAPHLDLTPPVITCRNGLNVNIMPTGEIQLWTSDFMLSVSDNVTPMNQIKIAIRKAGTGFGFPLTFDGDPILRVVFDCDEVGVHTVEIWAKDLAGNMTYCLTNVLIQDNLGNCWPLGDWLIEACVGTEAMQGLEDGAVFELTGAHPNEPFYVHEVPGGKAQCMYYDVPVGSDVTVRPVNEDNPLNGVTTYDMVLIAKHYRGIELLNSPYKIIAADVNGDGLVNPEDSIELQKLILGIYDELPNNTSWRFVDKNYVFPDPSNPFSEAFPETVKFQNIQNPGSAEFIAIKVGDVNGTSVANLANSQERTIHQENPIIGLPRPNPTQGDAILPIYLPNAENLRIELSDLTGKLLWVNDLQLEAGNHHVEIPTSSMSGKGVYVWRIWAGEVAKAGKLVRL